MSDVLRVQGFTDVVRIRLQGMCSGSVSCLQHCVTAGMVVGRCILATVEHITCRLLLTPCQWIHITNSAQPLVLHSLPCGAVLLSTVCHVERSCCTIHGCCSSQASPGGACGCWACAWPGCVQLLTGAGGVHPGVCTPQAAGESGACIGRGMYGVGPCGNELGTGHVDIA